MLLENCICGCENFAEARVNSIPIAICENCGIYRQRLDMTEQELNTYYEKLYHDGVYAHSIEHDKEVARKRLEFSRNEIKGRILDIGCGNGSFVIEARAKGFECYGIDISEIDFMDRESIYHGALDSINFPTDYFQTVTLHDSLEHMVNPVRVLEECFRILDEGGTLIIDFPSFFSDVGEHHWKSIEHIWMFRQGDIVRLLEKIGFNDVDVKIPIESKYIFYAQKPEQERTSILVPSGIGDVYWVMTKLESYIKKHNLGIPEVFIQSVQGKKQRSFDYLQKFPFLKAGGYRETGSNKFPEFQEGYLKNGRNIFENVHGCDLFMTYNGTMRFSRKLEETLPEYGVNWYPKMFRPLSQIKAGENYKKEHGKFVVAYFVDHGMYKGWLAQFSKEDIFQSMKSLVHRTNYKVILIGANWDVGGIHTSLMRMAIESGLEDHFIDLVGMTTLDDLLALLENCELVYGFPSGASLLGAYYKKQTVLLWSDYFQEGFHKFSCPSDSLGEWYHPLQTYKSNLSSVTQKLLEVVGE